MSEQNVNVNVSGDAKDKSDGARANIQSLNGLQKDKLQPVLGELSRLKSKLMGVSGQLREKRAEIFSKTEEARIKEEQRLAKERELLSPEKLVQPQTGEEPAATVSDTPDEAHSFSAATARPDVTEAPAAIADAAAPVPAPANESEPPKKEQKKEMPQEQKTALKSEHKPERTSEQKPIAPAPSKAAAPAVANEAPKETAPAATTTEAPKEARRVYTPPQEQPKEVRRVYTPPAEGDRYPRRENGNRVYIPPENQGRSSYPPRDGSRPYTPRTDGTRPPYQPRNPDGTPRTPYPPRTDGSRPFGRAPFSPPPPPVIPKDTKKTPVKKPTNPADDKKSPNKRALIKKGFIVDAFSSSELDEDGAVRVKMRKAQKKNEFIQPQNVRIETAVITTEAVPIKVLSEKIGKTGAEIIKKLFFLGIVKTINENIDFDTADLIASELGVVLEYKPEKTLEDALIESDTDVDDESVLLTRPPIVTIMGHVDHGKTSLLDYIRHANVALGEAGGITQHIGAYTVVLNDSPITFIDTPGHEAFTAMRARGAQVTDISVLVVAADDGIMPQTIEAINHSKSAGVEIIIAINKIDKNGAMPERIMQQLTEHNLIPEEWGGNVPVVKVSAKTGEGVQTLLENILLVAEVQNLKANPNRAAKGTIIEAKLDKGRGPLATVLVKNGTLRIGDYVVAGVCTGKIRAMFDDKGRSVSEAGPSVPVSVIGFSEVPNAGDSISAVADERFAKQLAEERVLKERALNDTVGTPFSLDDAFSKIKSGLIKDLNIIIKVDGQGSTDALKQSLVRLSNEEVKINVIHVGVGAVNESDVMLAGVAKAIIIAFNVRPDANAQSIAKQMQIDIRQYRVIYDAIDDVKKAIHGMLAPKYKETVLGSAEVRATFKITGSGTVAGSYVTDGKIVRNAKIRVLRDNVLIYEGEIASLKRLKDDVKEVQKGYECGISISNFNDIKEGDVFEAFLMEQIDL
ncbi:MAG: translation initiation factor IF-2 [Clostridiaceae bacterium]|nr:translation initiation factor IF-2 [Clostridiaceae bacterium]